MSRTAKTRQSQGRDRLLAAAKELLWERGYEDMSPRDIMDRSGAGQGSLYHHFDSKQGLARAALEEMVAEEAAAVAAIFAAGVPPIERISAYLTRERKALRGCRIGRLGNEAAMADPVLREPVAAYFGHVEGLIARTIREGQATGAMNTGVDADAFAAALLALIEGGYILARAHWDAERMQRAIRGGEAMLAALRSGAHPVSSTAAPTVPAVERVESPDGGFY